MGDSNIMEVNPATGETTIKYGAAPNQKMFTGHMGKHQILENGNILITEAMAGRAFEVNPHGDIVWEFVNRYDEDTVALVTEATRYPENYFTVKDWKCDGLK
jgi:hypothetical protein